MQKKPIDSAIAKNELVRINNKLDSPLLLVGGLAVQQYRVTRKSKDLDLVCDDNLIKSLVEFLYPSNEWNVQDENEDEYRPSYRITHRTKNLGVIAIGPKITEREPYKYVEWSELLEDTRPFRYKKRELKNILIPSATGLAYTKLLSFFDRKSKNPAKAKQDLRDFVNLSNDNGFAPILLLTLIQRGEATEYIREHLQLLSKEEKELLDKSSVYALQNLFGVPLTSVQQQPLSNVPSTPSHEMSAIVKEIANIALKHQGKRPTKTNAHAVLVVVGIQNDFFEGGALAAGDTGSLIIPLNDLIRRAETDGMEIVFARDWHPSDHSSFSDWGVHCIAEKEGALFHQKLYRPKNAHIVDIGSTNDMDGYSPFSDPRLHSLVACDRVKVIYVVGIALEFCVLAACRDAIWYGKTVIAVEPYIRAASRSATEREHAWRLLTSLGVIRAQNMAIGRE